MSVNVRQQTTTQPEPAQHECAMQVYKIPEIVVYYDRSYVPQLLFASVRCYIHIYAPLYFIL